MGPVGELSLFVGVDLDAKSASFAHEEELGILSYLDLRQLTGIIEQKENWSEFFSLGLHLKGDALSGSDFTDAIEDIALVRNKVAHSRPVSARDVERLRRAGRVLGFPMN
jgi:hypothetical protein